jgi:hypothetical protein
MLPEQAQNALFVDWLLLQKAQIRPDAAEASLSSLRASNAKTQPRLEARTERTL